MNKFIFTSFLFSCAGEEKNIDVVEEVQGPLHEILDSFSPERLRDDVDFLASDEMGGRIPGSPGHALARDYILSEMEAAGLTPLRLDGSFIQPYESDPIEGRYQFDEDGKIVPNNVQLSHNLVGVIPGSDPDLADEHIVLMAHYDHLGVSLDGEVFNGAFDNATSVAMALEIARVLIERESQPKRSIIFLFTDDEESGLDGAHAWLQDTTIPVEDIIFGISADPTGRPVLPDFWPIVLMGLERSPTLQERWRQTAAYSDVPVYFIHRDAIPVFASDHDQFFENETPIPAVWYTNPGMSFYHTPGDTPITVDYRILLANTHYLAQLLYDFGSDGQRYEYTGSPEMDAEMAKDAKELFEGVLDSEHITRDEKDMAEFYIGELDKVIEENDINALGHPEGFFFGAAYFFLFELTGAHPGEIPPPFPGE